MQEIQLAFFLKITGVNVFAPSRQSMFPCLNLLRHKNRWKPSQKMITDNIVRDQFDYMVEDSQYK